LGEIEVMLIANNEFNCPDTIIKSIEVFKKSLFVPNAFAPDFGGGNDLVKVWKPTGIGLRRYLAQIFNTYGELLWSSDVLDSNGSPTESWDGTYRGNAVHQDVYVWKIDAVFLDGKIWEGMAFEKGGKKRTMGDVTLIR